jgi:hypothetical protein
MMRFAAQKRILRWMVSAWLLGGAAVIADDDMVVAIDL